MTLDEMLQRVATHTGTTSELIKVSGAYTGNALILANKFKSALNYAKDKITNEKYSPDTSENVVIGSDLKFSLNNLSKRFKSLIRILKDDTELAWEKSTGGKIKLPLATSGDIVTVEYKYVPADLVNLTDTLDFPEYIVSHEIPCFYAAYEYFVTEGNVQDLDKSAYWLGLWNDGLSNIIDSIGESYKVKTIFSVEGV